MEKQKNFELNKDMKKDVSIADYTNCPVGLEFEAMTDGQGRDLADHFKVDYEKTNGMGKKVHKVQMTSYGGNKANIEVTTDENKYEKAGYVTQVYEDGSIDDEVVTRPVQIKELKNIKAVVFDHMKGIGADFFADGKGGLHMTFLTNKHASLSFFDPAVVTNLIQLARAYFKEILNEFPGENGYTRKLGYRNLPSKYERDNPGADGKYCGIHTKKDDDGNITMVEIRIPDGTKDWDLIVKQVKFWSAMIRHAAIITRYGRLSIPQEVWDKQTAWIRSKSTSKFKAVNCPRMKELLKLINNSLNWYGYYEKVSDKKGTEVMEMRLAGNTNCEIAKVVYGKSTRDWKVVDKLKEMEGGY